MIMKKLRIIFILFLASFGMQAQQKNLNGYWEGTLKQLDNGEEQAVRIFIDDNNAYLIDSEYLSYEFPVSISKGFGDQIIFIWMNKSDVWTETQIYSLSYIDDSTVSVHFMRHVTNKKSDFNSEDWGYTALGRLKKVKI
jgi:hypothetical protein